MYFPSLRGRRIFRAIHSPNTTPADNDIAVDMAIVRLLNPTVNW